MNTEEQILWTKLIDFKFDEPGTTFTFAKRLANENGWNLIYTERVIIEYKRFMFLCATSGSMVTPSDPVDQAWHLHMIYTNSYWNKLCKDILGKQIHHNPTKGGKKKKKKYNNIYNRTRNLYKEKFGVDQPADIWQGNEERFSDIDFQRVNMRKNWVLPKPRIFVRNNVFVLLLSLLGLSFVAMTDGEVFWIVTIGIIVGILLLIFIFNSGGSNNNKRNRGGGSSSSSNSGSGCSSSSGGFFLIGCGSSGSDSHSSGSGCSSGSSGCGSSGCSSGCGGGGCGGGGCSS